MNFNELANNNSDTFWQGGADTAQIEKLEQLLGIKLPSVFKEFLQSPGGGGVADSEISGIEDNNAALDFGGTVYGDTLGAREDFELPEHLVVIFYKDDEICWCIDTCSPNGQVVSYDVFKKKVGPVIANNFGEFFSDYVSMRL
ncbi:SMI1 / KNR4 family protein [Grimontia celer]|uniref:SMI1 / KNR4 family protein n=1 Tax=Grimontia celer TaxID=1796497 RepID=A0A128F2X2_9GAMM|nr:SMI1/KNR4 family protein [Grimontia celer]CZF80596.1 SMI1 / KNR4 family protein [Grimontia celer]